MNKNLNKNILIAVFCCIAASILLLFLSRSYIISQAEKHIENLLLSHKGIHHYVQNDLIPSLWRYKKEQKIPEDFYAPELFSSSYIVRNQHKYYNDELEKSGYPALYYKLAAINPRNPVNKADALEEELIQRFNDDRSLKKYREIIELDGTEYLYVAIPFLENQKRCLVCHGKREDAPQELQDRYPGEGGFNEQIGEIRAITSIRTPLNNEFHPLYIIIPSLTIGIFALALLLVFNSQLRRKVRSSTTSLEQEIKEKQDFAERLAEREKYLKSIQDSMQVGLFLINRSNFIVEDINAVAMELIGTTKDNIIGKKCFSFFSKSTEHKCPLSKNKNIADKLERTLLTNDGKKIPILKSASLITIAKSEYILETFIDISEKVKAQKIISESEKKLRNFLESTSSVPWELDLQTEKFTLMGPQIETILGYPAESWETLQNWVERLHPDHSEDALSFCKIDNGESKDQDFIYRALHMDGTKKWLRVVVSVVRGEGGPQKLVGFIQDITSQKELEKEKDSLEARLNQAQKLEAIGTLAGGIAHDFNNILGVILGYSELAIDDAQEGSSLKSDLEKIRSAGSRAKDLVKQILAFSRQAQIERLPIKIQSLIKEGLKMLRSSIPSTISIVQKIDANCGVILADPTQVHQVLMNLCTNAYHAMETKGGELTVSLKNMTIDAQDKELLAHLPPGEYVELTVSDTGCGIGPDILDKIFDPYFTTKGIGKGTGMGLAIIHGIIKNYGGAITVESKLHQGTSFHVFFPAAQNGTSISAKDEETILTGSERVLFIDDEELLADMGKNMIERLGYKVTVQISSLEALKLFEENPHGFDIVITDQTMPDMTGSDLARRMLQIRPDLPIILCTGYSNLIDESSAKMIGIKEFTLKPITRENISKLIRKALGDNSS